MTRHYPLDAPRARLLRMLPDVPAGLGPISAKHKITLADYPTGPDHVSKSIFWFGDFDPWVVRTMIRLARDGDTVCDIGANIGDTALPLARHVGTTGRIFCFEPFPPNLDRLENNIKANGFTQISVVPIALSNTSGRLRMVVPDGQPGMARLRPEGYLSNAIHVETMRFDDWIRPQNLSSISVVKLDVEGHELSVLRGMRNTLGEGRIGAFVVELHGIFDPEHEMVRLFTDNGYRILRICKGRRATKFVDPLVPLRGQPTCDYVAVLKNSLAEKRLYENDKNRPPR